MSIVLPPLFLQNSNLIDIVCYQNMSIAISSGTLVWQLIISVNCVCLNWQLKIQILMFGSKIGVTNVSIGSIDNYLNTKCITNTVLLRTCQFGKIGN